MALLSESSESTPGRSTPPLKRIQKLFGIRRLRLTEAKAEADLSNFRNLYEAIIVACVFKPEDDRTGVEIVDPCEDNPTWCICHELKKRLDYSTIKTSLSIFAANALRGCKFCALLLREISLCVPSSTWEDIHVSAKFGLARLIVLGARSESGTPTTTLEFFNRESKDITKALLNEILD
jgi:hypothetical protein